MDLFDGHGHRKYLTAAEWRCFVTAAKNASPEVDTFCQTLAWTGCRISEALGLTEDRCDLSAEYLVFECLKKRRRGVFRAVPVPRTFLTRLAEVHGLGALPKPARERRRLWTWCRTTAWRRVCEVMDAAGIHGLHSTPKALRHSLGTRGVDCGVPLHLLQRWLGHSSLSVTASYCAVYGQEERNVAQRMWEAACA